MKPDINLLSQSRLSNRFNIKRTLAESQTFILKIGGSSLGLGVYILCGQKCLAVFQVEGFPCKETERLHSRWTWHNQNIVQTALKQREECKPGINTGCEQSVRGFRYLENCRLLLYITFFFNSGLATHKYCARVRLCAWFELRHPPMLCVRAWVCLCFGWTEADRRTCVTVQISDWGPRDDFLVLPEAARRNRPPLSCQRDETKMILGYIFQRQRYL